MSVAEDVEVDGAAASIVSDDAVNGQGGDAAGVVEAQADGAAGAGGKDALISGCSDGKRLCAGA